MSDEINISEEVQELKKQIDHADRERQFLELNLEWAEHRVVCRQCRTAYAHQGRYLYCPTGHEILVRFQQLLSHYYAQIERKLEELKKVNIDIKI